MTISTFILFDFSPKLQTITTKVVLLILFSKKLAPILYEILIGFTDIGIEIFDLQKPEIYINFALTEDVKL